MIVLDTNVVSELMKAAPHPGVVAWTDRQAEETLFITSITLAEIRFGIAALPAGRRRTTLGEAFENGIRPLFGSRVLDFDEAASKTYARVRADTRARGLSVGDVDAMIAAIALAHRSEIASRDVAPFEAAGIRVTNPFS